MLNGNGSANGTVKKIIVAFVVAYHGWLAYTVIEHGNQLARIEQALGIAVVADEAK
jgi:hypothetical protein